MLVPKYVDNFFRYLNVQEEVLKKGPSSVKIHILGTTKLAAGKLKY